MGVEHDALGELIAYVALACIVGVVGAVAGAIACCYHACKRICEKKGDPEKQTDKSAKIDEKLKDASEKLPKDKTKNVSKGSTEKESKDKSGKGPKDKPEQPQKGGPAKGPKGPAAKGPTPKGQPAKGPPAKGPPKASPKKTYAMAVKGSAGPPKGKTEKMTKASAKKTFATPYTSYRTFNEQPIVAVSHVPTKHQPTKKRISQPNSVYSEQQPVRMDRQASLEIPSQYLERFQRHTPAPVTYFMEEEVQREAVKPRFGQVKRNYTNKVHPKHTNVLQANRPTQKSRSNVSRERKRSLSVSQIPALEDEITAMEARDLEFSLFKKKGDSTAEAERNAEKERKKAEKKQKKENEKAQKGMEKDKKSKEKQSKKEPLPLPQPKSAPGQRPPKPPVPPRDPSTKLTTVPDRGRAKGSDLASALNQVMEGTSQPTDQQTSVLAGNEDSELAKAKRQRTACVQEIISVEERYVRLLKLISEDYMAIARKRQDLFSEASTRKVFVNIKEVYKFAKGHLELLKESVDAIPYLSLIGKCFLGDFQKKAFKVYADFTSNFPFLQEEYTKLQKDARYEELWQSFCKEKKINSQNFIDSLASIMQKSTRYVSEMEQLVHLTPPDHPDYVYVNEADAVVKQICVFINRRQRKVDNIEPLMSWMDTVNGWQGPGILEKSSELIYSGKLNKINTAGNAQERQFFLFDNQLVYCTKEGKDKYLYKDRIDLDGSVFILLPDGKDKKSKAKLKNAWRLFVKDREYTLCAESPEARQQWQEAFREERIIAEEDEEFGITIPDQYKMYYIERVKSKNGLPMQSYKFMMPSDGKGKRSNLAGAMDRIAQDIGHGNMEALVEWVEEQQHREEMEEMRHAVVICDFVPMDDRELEIHVGDQIEVSSYSFEGWTYGYIHDVGGWFPTSNIEMCEAPEVLPQRWETERAEKVENTINVERMYVKNIQSIVQGFMNPAKEKKDIFTEDQIKVIFGNITEVYTFARQFFERLQKSLDKKPHKSLLGPTFLAELKGFAVYSDYANNQPFAREEVVKIEQLPKYKKQNKFFEDCRKEEGTPLIPFSDFLAYPTQKLFKYPNQLMGLINLTPKDQPDYEHLKKARKAMLRIIDLVNYRQMRMNGIEKIARWQLSVNDWEGPDVLEESTELLHGGKLKKINSSGRAQERYFFLFDHQIVYCTKDILLEGVFNFKGRIDLDHATVVPLEDGKDAKTKASLSNAFRICEDSVKVEKAYTLCAKTPKVKEYWLKSLAIERKVVNEKNKYDFRVPRPFIEMVRKRVKTMARAKHSI